MKKSNIQASLILTGIGSSVLLSMPATAQKNREFTTEDGKPLNIIYIMSDDHTRQAISSYDQRFGITTPHIDKIAREGLIFENSYVANSISGPSRACLITGKHSHKNGFMNNENTFDGEQQTMPKLLQKAGYQTAMIGKWHLHSDPTGFDHWDILPGQGDYYTPVMYTATERKTYPGEYVADLITDKSIDWLEQRDSEKPFMLFVHHKTVHRNFMAKLSDLRAFENKTFPYPDNLFDNYKGRRAAAAQEMTLDKHYDMVYDLKMDAPDGKPTPLGWMFDNGGKDDNRWGTYGRMLPHEREAWDEVYDSIKNDFKECNPQGDDLVRWKYQRYVKDYLKTAKGMDDNIGRLMQYLEENNLLENTLVIYTSDQGFYMGEHGWYDKRFMYEESFSTPLIMRLPQRFNTRGTVTQMVQNIDHAPTFLEIAGAEIPADIQGESYLPLLKGKTLLSMWDLLNWRKSLYYHFYEYPAEHMVKRHYGIRTTRYKLIHFYNDIDEWELYDLKTDPNEMNNLINIPRHQPLVKKLKKQLYKLQVKYDDPIRNR